MTPLRQHVHPEPGRFFGKSAEAAALRALAGWSAVSFFTIGALALLSVTV